MVNARYRRHIEEIIEEQNSITFSLVVRTEDNITLTHGGGYVTLQKPVRETELDDAVQKIVAEGDRAFKKKLSQEDRDAMRPIPITGEHGRLRDMAHQKNKADWPSLGRRRG